MNLETGFRRITLSISLATLVAGVTVTVYDTYETVQYVSATKLFLECAKDEDKLPSSQRTGSCLYVLRAEPKHLTALLPITSWLPQSWDEHMHSASYPLALLPLIVGILASAGFGAIPWGVFYLVRWIVQGFSD